MQVNMQDEEWTPTQDGKGSWRVIGLYRLVVKEEDAGDWWWGVYTDADDDLQEEGYEDEEQDARQEAEGIIDLWS